MVTLPQAVCDSFMRFNRMRKRHKGITQRLNITFDDKGFKGHLNGRIASVEQLSQHENTSVTQLARLTQRSQQSSEDRLHLRPIDLSQNTDLERTKIRVNFMTIDN